MMAKAQRVSTKPYFSHDADAGNRKLKVLMRQLGKGAYFHFFKLLELMRMSGHDGFKLDISDSMKLMLIGEELMLTEEELLDFIKVCVEAPYELFKTDGDYLWSEGFQERMALMISVRKQKQAAGIQSGISRREQKGTETTSVRTQIDSVEQNPLLFEQNALVFNGRSTESTSVQQIKVKDKVNTKVEPTVAMAREVKVDPYAGMNGTDRLHATMRAAAEKDEAFRKANDLHRLPVRNALEEKIV